MADVRVSLSEQPLEVAATIARVGSDEVGGIGVFVGTVRVTAAVTGNEDKRVTKLFYEAHEPLAVERMNAIAEEATLKWDLRVVEAIHRVGNCSLGDPTVVVCCAAPHRHDALEACRWIIDEIKATVPIFKREDYADGSSWVGAEQT